MLCWNSARQIMGMNFFGYNEVSAHLGANPTNHDYQRLARVPFDEDTLYRRRLTHILAVIPGFSIMELRSSLRARGNEMENKLFRDAAPWYGEEQFANERGKIDWFMIRKVPMADGTNGWEPRYFVNGEGEGRMTARIAVLAALGHFLVSNERLFRGHVIQCSDTDALNKRVQVNFGEHGLSISLVENMIRAQYRHAPSTVRLPIGGSEARF